MVQETFSGYNNNIFPMSADGAKPFLDSFNYQDWKSRLVQIGENADGSPIYTNLQTLFFITRMLPKLNLERKMQYDPFIFFER